MRLILALCAVALLGCLPAHATPYDAWGREVMKSLNSSFLLPGGKLYADEIAPERPRQGTPCFCWGAGVMLSALSAAAHEDKSYVPALLSYGKALDVYWTEDKGVGGFQVLPHPNPADLYYDDNEWLALAYADAYEVTRDASMLRRAEDAMRFALSGEDNRLGGGIFWREQEKRTKNTCSNAPAIAAALKLYNLTRKPEYLAAAQRLYAWLNAHLQDTDGLYWDNINLRGRIDRKKYTYNSALMIRANVQLFEVTRDAKYLREAQRIASAAATHWIAPDTGAIRDVSYFAHLLAESFLYLSERDNDPKWPQYVRRAVAFLHDKNRDPNGYYPENWEAESKEALTKVRILNQASAARAYWMAARFKVP